MRSTPERPKTSSWSPWPTSWLVSRGLCCPAATSTDLQQRNGGRKGTFGLEALRPHFPTHHHDGLNFPTEVCKGAARTKEQSQRRVRNLLLRMVLNDRRV